MHQDTFKAWEVRILNHYHIGYFFVAMFMQYPQLDTLIIYIDAWWFAEIHF